MTIFGDLWSVIKGGLSKKGVEGMGQLSKVMVNEPINAVKNTYTNIDTIKKDNNIFDDINEGKRILKNNVDFATNKKAFDDDAKLESKLLNTNNKKVNSILDKLIITPTKEIGDVSNHIIDIGLDTSATVGKTVGIGGEIAVAGSEFVVNDGLKVLKTGENIIDYLVNHPYESLLIGAGAFIVLKKI